MNPALFRRLDNLACDYADQPHTAIVAVLGHFLFGETFGIKQIRIALIMSGVVLINQA